MKNDVELVWAGKQDCIAEADIPTSGVLVPSIEESLNWENTNNIFIEGDNIDALKLLQNEYLGKVKMIYIDPPYNTRSNKLYKDKFLHADWLSMMYPRLKLARNLLRDDGVIFISIDEREASNLRKLLDEVFGEVNLIGEFVIVKSEGGGLAKHMIKGHDYLFAFAKDINEFRPLMRPKDIRGKIVSKDGEDYWIEEDWLRKEFGKYGTCSYDEIEHYHGEKKKEEIDAGIRSGIYTLIEKNGIVIVGRLRKVAEDGSKFYSILKHLNKNGIEDLKAISLEKYFDFPKPLSLIREIILGCSFFKLDKDSIFLDFFAGSATTAHAVMQLNAEDGGNRQFIMVQLPELCDEQSEAFKAGYKNIAEIGKERIRRAGKKILEGECHELWNKDVGFRLYKIE